MVELILKAAMVLQICTTLAAHFVADFVLQNDKTAKGKSTSLLILSKHCLTYAGAMAVFSVLAYLSRDNYITIGLIAFVYYFVTHFVIDYITSKLTSHYWKQGKRHAFFCVIGIDQYIHTVCCIIFWIWFL